MLKLWLKHTIAESALERFFDNVFNNFDVDENVTVMLLSDVDESYYGKRIHKALFDNHTHICGEIVKGSSGTLIISMWVVNKNQIGVCYSLSDKSVHTETVWVNEAQIYLKE